MLNAAYLGVRLKKEMAEIIETYNHQGRIGVMVHLRCLDDIVFRTPEFKEVATGIAVHIAAKAPLALTASELSPEVRNNELAEIHPEIKGLDAEAQLQAINDANARINANYFLLSQPYVKNGELTVLELLEELSTTLRVNVEVIRFTRWVTNET